MLAPELPSGAFAIDAAGWPECDGEQAALGWGLATYRFTRYVKDEPREWPQLVVAEGVDRAAITDQLDAIFLARDLVNTPAGDLGPSELCDMAREIAKQYHAQIRIITGEVLERDFPAVHAVGMGSHRQPALIDLHWGKADHPKVTLVGKGVVFDSGGLDLKPPKNMLLMKKDMGGAAVTLALAKLVMARKLPVHLRLLIPTVENAIGPRAYRPGDVVRTRKGLTVEIGNTDAEGRVILCDALDEAVSDEPDLILDMATLTGAARVALGQDLPGFWTPSNEIADELLQASVGCVDPIWRMPLWLPYTSMLKSKIADSNNISESPMGGSITAALYLYQFVKPFLNWVHFDAYCWRTSDIPGTPAGGEASALRAVYNFLAQRYG
jgi:leucyl aminopeptidase